MVGVSRVAAVLREIAVPDPVRFGLASMEVKEL